MGNGVRRGARRYGPVILAGLTAMAAMVPSAAFAQTGERPVEAYIDYTQYRLENGLTLIVNRDRSIPVASVNVWYHVGSANEQPGRTGFAHLFEHIMFEGSAHVPEGDFDNLLEAAGGINNGSTNADRTNYFEDMPSPALELALWLEADRMGFLLETMDQRKLDLQREVVKNERRQSYENRPYGLAWETLLGMLYPEGHPYSWPVIGSMEDLSAATLDDVKAFFRTYYAPNNASITVSGDVSPRRVRDLVEKYFGDIPAGPALPPVEIPDATLPSEVRRVMEDDVQLPRLYMAWHTPPAFAESDAALGMAADVLGRGRTSRLQQRLVYDDPIAQSVSVFNYAQKHGGVFEVMATARPGVSLSLLEAAIREELQTAVSEGVAPAEVERALAQTETGFVRLMERSGWRADELNAYSFYTGDPGYLRKDLARYRALSAEDLETAIGEFLLGAHGAVLSVVPRGREDLAAPGEQAGAGDASEGPGGRRP